MRRFFSIILAFGILYLLFSSTSLAQTASSSAQNDYQLPYAGLLPDSPLYFLKALRDKVEEFLISDPLKKAEFDLKAADKRLSMGISLFDERKYSLSEGTISKGENYFEDGLKNMEEIEKQGRAIDPGLLVSYDLSTRKHKEILEGLIKRSSGTVKQKLENNLKRIERFVLKVNQLKLEQQL